MADSAAPALQRLAAAVSIDTERLWNASLFPDLSTARTSTKYSPGERSTSNVNRQRFLPVAVKSTRFSQLRRSVTRYSSFDFTKRHRFPSSSVTLANDRTTF